MDKRKHARLKVELDVQYTRRAKIAAYLDRKGYKTRTGKQFYNKFICDILKNQIYIGKIVWNKKHYDKNQKTKKHSDCVAISKTVIASNRRERSNLIYLRRIRDCFVATLLAMTKNGIMTQPDDLFCNIAVI